MRGVRQEILNLAGGAIAVGLVAILAFLTWALVMRQIPDANREPMLLLIGGLFTQISMVVAFYYGSSSTSKRQSETIDTLASTAAKAQEAALPPAMPSVTLAPGETATVAAENNDGTSGKG